MRLFVVVAVVLGLGVGASFAAAPKLVSDLKPAKGRGTAPPGATGNGPWATGIRFATSTDGLTFKPTGESLTDQAGVPALLVDPDKRLRCYYMDFGNGDAIAVAIQTAPHKWVYKRVTIKGAPTKPPATHPADPAVVLLPDKRYRLYYMQDTGQFNLAIYSAISTDGITFTREPGVRFQPADKQVFDPTVLKTAGGWLLWTGPDGAYSATSTDGLAFKAAGAFSVGGAGFMTWAAAAVPGGGYRVFGNGVGGGGGGSSSSALSTDGKSWVLDPGSRLTEGAADVGVVALDAKHWMLAYLVTLP